MLPHLGMHPHSGQVPQRLVKRPDHASCIGWHIQHSRSLRDHANTLLEGLVTNR